jgi:hypothetical protein
MATVVGTRAYESRCAGQRLVSDIEQTPTSAFNDTLIEEHRNHVTRFGVQSMAEVI